VRALDHLTVDEQGQLQEPRVGDGRGQVGAVEQGDLRTDNSFVKGFASLSGKAGNFQPRTNVIIFRLFVLIICTKKY
jgi:hypothetical protein